MLRMGLFGLERAVYILCFGWSLLLLSSSAELEEFGLEQRFPLQANSIHVCDFDGSIVVAGSIFISEDQTDIFVWKLSGDFVEEWFSAEGDPLKNDGLNSAICDKSGFVIAVGYTDGKFPDSDMTPPHDTKRRDSLIVRYSQLGNIVQAIQEGDGTNDYEMKSVSLSPNGNVVMSGNSVEPTQVGPGDGTFIVASEPTLASLPWGLKVGGTPTEMAVSAKGIGNTYDLLGNDVKRAGRRQRRKFARIVRAVDDTGVEDGGGGGKNSVLWFRTIETPRNVTGVAMEKDLNGFPIVLQNREEEINEAWITKFDSSSNILRETQLPLSRGADEEWYAVNMHIPQDGNTYFHLRKRLSPDCFEEYLFNYTSSVVDAGTSPGESRFFLRESCVDAIESPESFGLNYFFYDLTVERSAAYFLGRSSQGVASEYSVYRTTDFLRSFTTDVESRTTELTVQVAINAGDGDILGKTQSLRDIIASDFPILLSRIDDPSIMQLDVGIAFARVGYTLRVGCGDVEDAKETLKLILDSETTGERLESTVWRLGDVSDDKTCLEAPPTSGPAPTDGAGEPDVGGNPPSEDTTDDDGANVIAIVAGTIGGVLGVLLIILLYFWCCRPHRSSVHDVYRTADNEIVGADQAVSAHEVTAAGKAALTNSVSFGGQGDII
ncbi:hypothetical protein NDN08_001719 [Rhodosorus marinus]|uniref:Uncharacterized protein n=1 Tax=Rhodosorus marinus TaxID=101924 RepID=A0AAV8URL5_9RHOD|nr:hypothetical protein NDN08_001719 [Rhodosorus marinus]